MNASKTRMTTFVNSEAYILRDKTIDDKLMYISNDDNQNNPDD